MDSELVKGCVTIIGAILSGVLAARWTMQAKLKEIEKTAEIAREQQKEEDRERLKEGYLDPLHAAAQTFLERLEHINNDYIKKKSPLFFDTALQLEANHSGLLPEGVPYQLWQDDTERFDWANSYGHLIISTIRITSIYFCHANRILEEFPFVKLTSEDDFELRRRIIDVRKSLGGPFGIWEDLQDSLGKYILREDGKIMNYRYFCQNEILHQKNYVWFRTPRNFYRDFHLKTEEERQKMIDSLRYLCSFLKEKTDTPPQRSNKK